MMIEQVTRYTNQELHELAAGKRIVILYPQIAYRNLFLAPFLDRPGESVYYRPSRNQLPLEEFVAEWASVLEIDCHEALDLIQQNQSADAGSVYGGQIASRYPQQTVLLLDEIDQLETTVDLNEFLHAMALSLHAQIQLVVNSRNLWSDPWKDLIHSGIATVIGLRERRSELRFTSEPSQRPQLEIYGFGAGSAFLNGKELNTWDGILPRNLFFYFADHKMLTRNQIFETFWPDLGVKEATNVFHVTKRKITENLMIRADSPNTIEIMSFLNGFYHASIDVTVHYDVADFEFYANRAMQPAADHERKLDCERALALYRGSFLGLVNMPWAIERREKLSRVYLDLLILYARLQTAEGNLISAFNSYIQAIREAPQREDLQRKVMMLYVELGRPDDARSQYHFLRNYLRTSYGIEPSPETRALYETFA